MDFIEVSGKTVEDAVTEATIKLGVTSDMLDYEVIDKGSNGFLGIGSKQAVIKARKKEECPKEEIKVEAPAAKPAETKAVQSESAKAPAAEINADEVTAEVKSFLSKVFNAMDLEVEIEAEFKPADKAVDVELKGNDMGVLIGKRGQTLDSLQYLVNLAVNKKSAEYVKVKLDTEDYRERRKETLENLAKNIAYKVKRTHRPVSLEPMNPFERRIIHSALQNDKFVATYSEGEEPYRHVVVVLKK
ncbi:MAG: protein jag [Lachnospiraceae bacterium]|nr:protein jag [Lachnospiraceae bacterium]